jgi:hypothetical protein
MTLNDWVEILGVTTTAIIVVVVVGLVISQFWRGDR